MAKDAYDKQAELRYKLQWWWYPRPKPDEPIWYRITSTVGVTVRAGKSFKNEVVHFLEHGDKVLVDQMKGKRCRFCKAEKANGEPYSENIVGWISVHTADDRPVLLIRRRAEFIEFRSYCEDYQTRHKNDFGLKE